MEQQGSYKDPASSKTFTGSLKIFLQILVRSCKFAIVKGLLTCRISSTIGGMVKMASAGLAEDQKNKA